MREDVHPTDENYKKLHDMMEGVDIWSPDWAKVLQDLPAGRLPLAPGDR